MRRIYAKALAVLTLLAAGVVPAFGADYTVGPIKIVNPWTRVTPDASKVAGGFMTLTNIGKEADTLIGGTAAIAGRLEVHEMALDGGVMKMRELKPGLVIKAGETVTLKPGSYHVMFLELKQKAAQGQPFKGTLVFEKAGTIEIEYTVEPFGTRAPGDGGQAMPRGSGSGSGSGAMKPKGN